MTVYSTELSFGCSRCGQRQATDTSCEACGNAIVQDLRESRIRFMFRDIEQRDQSKRHARYISIAAAIGVAVIIPCVTILNGGKLGIIAGLASAVVVLGALEATLGRRKKFPYLDAYDK